MHCQGWLRSQRIKRLYSYLQSMSVIGGGGNKMRMDTNTSRHELHEKRNARETQTHELGYLGAWGGERRHGAKVLMK